MVYDKLGNGFDNAIIIRQMRLRQESRSYNLEYYTQGLYGSLSATIACNDYSGENLFLSIYGDDKRIYISPAFTDKSDPLDIVVEFETPYPRFIQIIVCDEKNAAFDVTNWGKLILNDLRFYE